jgi:peptide/nickel transport system permease protein
MLHGVFILLGISFFVFVLLYLSEDPVRLMLPSDATAEEFEPMRRQLGFDKPFSIQYHNCPVVASDHCGNC